MFPQGGGVARNRIHRAIGEFAALPLRERRAVDARQLLDVAQAQPLQENIEQYIGVEQDLH